MVNYMTIFQLLLYQLILNFDCEKFVINWHANHNLLFAWSATWFTTLFPNKFVHQTHAPTWSFPFASLIIGSRWYKWRLSLWTKWKAVHQNMQKLSLRKWDWTLPLTQKALEWKHKILKSCYTCITLRFVSI